MSIVETIIKKFLLVCLIPFFIILKLLAFILFYLLSISIYPIKYFIINFRDLFLGKSRFLFKRKHDKYYKAPLITYYFSSFPIVGLLASMSILLHNEYFSQTYQIDVFVEIISYFISVIFYILIFYFGMYRRFKLDSSKIKSKKILLDILSIHRQFLNLSFIPLTFVITVIGIVSALKIPITVRLLDFNNFLNYTLKHIFILGDSENFLMILLAIILYIIAIFILLYIFSIPLQLIALFVNYVFKYFYEHGNYYKSIFKEFENKL
ncbi:hypothetical protein ACWEXZ_10550 [Staphylococcus xylosus]